MWSTNKVWNRKQVEKGCMIVMISDKSMQEKQSNLSTWTANITPFLSVLYTLSLQYLY